MLNQLNKDFEIIYEPTEFYINLHKNKNRKNNIMRFSQEKYENSIISHLYFSNTSIFYSKKYKEHIGNKWR